MRKVLRATVKRIECTDRRLIIDPVFPHRGVLRDRVFEPPGLGQDASILQPKVVGVVWMKGFVDRLCVGRK